MTEPLNTLEQAAQGSSAAAELAERLEAAWRVAPTTNLDAFLPPSGDPSRRQVLLAVIELDMRLAWLNGQPRTLEQYLKRYPEIGPAADAPAALVIAEYRVRRLTGAPVAVDDYRSRFPAQFAELERRIAADNDPDTTEDQEPTFRLSLPGAPPSLVGSKTAVGLLPGAPSPPRAGTPPPPSVATISQVLPVSEGFKLFRRIGRGQYGEVFLGEAPGGVNVAVKRIFRPLDDASSQRELQSLQLIRELRHPYLLQTQAFWSLEDRLVIVMELADDSLADWNREVRRVSGEGVPVGDLLAYFGEAAEALDYLHGMNVLHRDVKPANLLRLKGHAKVADFGLARMMESQLATATFCGTPLYMAPEVWKKKISPQSDQYSLAAAYAEMRLGRPVYSGTDYVEICLQHTAGKPDLAPLGPAEQRVLLRALAKEPENRYPDCRSFVAALSAALAPPPPKPAPPRRGAAGLLATALGLLALAAAAFGVWATIAPPTRPTVVEAPPTAPPAPLLPAGCQPDGAEMEGRYYRRVLAPLEGAPPVLFLLIPRKQSTDLRPFYIMQDKVSNGQFNAAAAGPPLKGLLEEAAAALGPWAVRRQWNKEGRGEPDKAALPVVYVTYPEALCFARSLGGHPPTTEQWEKAAGRKDGAAGPFTGKPVGRAIARRQATSVIGPLPAGDPEGDRTLFGCYDMADNGREWTATAPGGDQLLDLRDLTNGSRLYLRGGSFVDEEVFVFKDLERRQELKPVADSPRYDLGFRVVIEAPEAPE